MKGGNLSNAQLKNKIQELEASIEQYAAENAALKKQLSAATGTLKRAELKKPTKVNIPANNAFVVDGHTYTVVIPKFIFRKEEVTVLDVLADEALQVALVEAKANVIKKIK